MSARPISILFVAATRAEWRGACGMHDDRDDDCDARDNGVNGFAMPPHEQCIHTFTAKNGRECAVLLTGVGPVNAAMALAKELEGARRARLVLNVGLAGSFDLVRAPLYSHWRVLRESYAEYGLVRPGQCADARALGFPQWDGESAAQPDALLEDGAKNSVPNAPPDVLLSASQNALPNAHTQGEQCIWDCVDLRHDVSAQLMSQLPLSGNAHSLTVAGVTACTQRARALQERFGRTSAQAFKEYTFQGQTFQGQTFQGQTFQGQTFQGQTSHEQDSVVLLENMEGFALALVCARYGLPFAQVRTVSNAVGPRTDGSFDFRGAMAALGDVVQPLLCT